MWLSLIRTGVLHAFPVLVDQHGTDTWNASYASLHTAQPVLGIDARGNDVTDDGLERWQHGQDTGEMILHAQL